MWQQVILDTTVVLGPQASQLKSDSFYEDSFETLMSIKLF